MVAATPARRIARAAADAVPILGALRRRVRRVRVRRRLAAWTEALAAWTEADERAARFYSAWIEPDDLVFDVGANVGKRAKVFANLARTVVAVEPGPDALHLLRYGAELRSNIVIEECACGSGPGRAQLLVPDMSNLASLSTDWINAVKNSGRFSNVSWDRAHEVELTTLDALVAKYGRPAFIKIDVEGYEPEVLAGLSEPVSALSFEVTAERLDAAAACVKRLKELSCYHYAFSHGETMELAVHSLQSDEILHWLDEALSRVPRLLGDVYATSCCISRSVCRALFLTYMPMGIYL